MTATAHASGTRQDGWQLVAAAQAGNADAFGELWKRHQPHVQRFISGKVRDQATAEDLTSETFLQAWQAIGSVTNQGRDFGAWLTAIARNKVIDHARAAARSRVLVPTTPISSGESGVADAAPGPDATVPEQIDRAGLSDRVNRYVQQLPEREQECLRLRYAEELSGEQMSEVLGCSPSGARTLQYRAAKRLGALLADDGYTSSAGLAAANDDQVAHARDALARLRQHRAKAAAIASAEQDRAARARAWGEPEQIEQVPSAEVA